MRRPSLCLQIIRSKRYPPLCKWATRKYLLFTSLDTPISNSFLESLISSKLSISFTPPKTSYILSLNYSCKSSWKSSNQAYFVTPEWPRWLRKLSERRKRRTKLMIWESSKTSSAGPWTWRIRNLLMHQRESPSWWILNGEQARQDQGIGSTEMLQEVVDLSCSFTTTQTFQFLRLIHWRIWSNSCKSSQIHWISLPTWWILRASVRF